MRCFVVLVFLFLNVNGLTKPSFLGGVKPVLEEHGLMKPTSDNLLKFLSNKRSLPPQQIGQDLPTSFDTRQAFPGCIHGVLDQGRCGSCWAFASSEVLSDRLCIDLKVNVTLSPQNLLECEKEHLGCLMGSMPEWAWGFLTRTKEGITTLDCIPYTSGSGKYSPFGCETKCSDGSPIKHRYKASNFTQAGDFIDASKHIDKIMRALMTGPLDATFIVYADFDEYQPGEIYSHKSGSIVGLHSVKIVGWGEKENVKYWTVQNSWGSNWGDHGFFKIVRGEDDCMFESQVFYGNPEIIS